MNPYGTLTADKVVTDLGSKLGMLPPKGEPAKSEQTTPAIVRQIDNKMILGIVGAAAILLLLTRRK